MTVKNIEYEEDLAALVNQVTRGRVVSFRVVWTPKDLSLQTDFISERQPTEACRMSAALALRAAMEEVRALQVTAFSVFWDGGEVTHVEKTIVCPYPLEFIRLTISVV